MEKENLGGGVANYLRRLLDSLDSSQVDVAYLPVGRRGPSSPGWKRPFEYLHSVWRLDQTLRKVRPDVIHMNPSLNWPSLMLYIPLILWASWRADSALMLFFHGWNVQIGNQLAQNNLKSRFLRSVLQRADFYLVLASQFKQQLIQAGFPEIKISISTLMIEIPEQQLSGANQRSSKQVTAEYQVLFLSRVVKEKGVWTILEAVKWWHSRHPQAPLCIKIAGDGSERQALEDAIQKDKLQQYVECVGYVRGAQKERLFQDADVFILPSYHPEGLPNVILESMAAGLPIVYTPMGALEYILGPENGIRIESADLSGESLGTALWQLYEEPGRRLAMGKANEKLVGEKYDAKIVSERMLQQYISLADTPTLPTVKQKKQVPV